MKTKAVIGKRIIAVHQSRVKTSAGMTVTVDAIELDDGTLLRPVAYETETEPVGDLLVRRPRPAARATAADVRQRLLAGEVTISRGELAVLRAANGGPRR